MDAADNHERVVTADREYIGFIWIGDDPGIRLSIWAMDSSEAAEKLVERYGEGHVYSIWNEADESRPR